MLGLTLTVQQDSSRKSPYTTICVPKALKNRIQELRFRLGIDGSFIRFFRILFIVLENHPELITEINENFKVKDNDKLGVQQLLTKEKLLSHPPEKRVHILKAKIAKEQDPEKLEIYKALLVEFTEQEKKLKQISSNYPSQKQESKSQISVTKPDSKDSNE